MSGADSLDLHTVFEGSSPMAEDIVNKWTEWDSARSIAKLRWSETQQYVYATSTRETPGGNIGGLDTEGGAGNGWNHSTHIPKLTQIKDNITAAYISAILPSDDFFDFIGEDLEASEKKRREIVTSYLMSKHRNNDLPEFVEKWIDDYVMYGICFGRVSYRRKTTGEDNIAKVYVGPEVGRISPNDIVFNPLASSFEKSPKIVRSLKTMGELARDLEESPELGYSKAVFDKAVEIRSSLQQGSAEDFNKHVQLTFDGYGTASQYFGSGYVEILEFYGDMYDITNNKFLKNHVITVIDRSFVIRSEPLETWSGGVPIYSVGWRERQDNLWAMGPLDNLVGMQYLINHLENAKADAFDQMIEPTRVLVGEVENHGAESGQPGGEFRIPGGEGSVSNLAPDTTILSAPIEIERKFAQMEEFVGSPKQEMGIKPAGEQTATQVNQLSRAASRIFQNKIVKFERFLGKILNAELEAARDNLDGEDLVSVVGEDGVVIFESITREDLKSNGKIVPRGASRFERQAQLLNNFQILQQSFVQDPGVLVHFPSKKLAFLMEELMGYKRNELVEINGRVAEQADLARLQQAATIQVESENSIDLSEDIPPEGDVSDEEPVT